jgi:hypothetical protein
MICFVAHADTTKIALRPMMGEHTLQLSTPYNMNGYVLEVEALWIYIGEVEAHTTDNSLFYHLLGMSSDENHLNSISKFDYDQQTTAWFCVGVDSTSQVSGAMRGALDPQKGMYWAWQSGYISFKLEGKYYINSHDKLDFAFHLGGYQPHTCSQWIALNKKDDGDFIFYLDLKPWLEQVDFSIENHVMSPGKKAYEMFKMLIQG